MPLTSSGKIEDFIYSAGAGTNRLTNETDLRTRKDKSVLLFRPNVPGFFSIAAETKFITLAYGFTTSAENQKIEESFFEDVRITGSYRRVDFRLNYQRYKGAIVDEAGVEAFYKDYETRSINGRGNYYFSDNYLLYVRDGHELIRYLASNDGFSAMGTSFAGLNIDHRKIHLPTDLVPAHANKVNSKNLNYDSNINALILGPLLGGDGTVYYHKAFARGKIGVGPAFVLGGETLIQTEVALNVGLAFGKRHLISLGVDIYQVSYRSKDAKIGSTNSQASIFYTYSFKQ